MNDDLGPRPADYFPQLRTSCPAVRKHPSLLLTPPAQRSIETWNIEDFDDLTFNAFDRKQNFCKILELLIMGSANGILLFG